ncbi:MAG: HIT domain-containing protein [Armatimonadetes bacterium]|nr:HIT domain-containing protein [Armatimonadota bacterium]
MAERLWAPWRFDYIAQAGKSGASGNIFVDLPAEDSDRENLILFRGRTAFVIMNRFPYTNGHLMVAPYQQTPEIGGLDDEELLEINRLIARCIEWLRTAYEPEGFNVGVNLGAAAGAGIASHLHWHVVPRWSGDTNFMTTVADTRVIPQDLRDSYDLLKKIIEGSE